MLRYTVSGANAATAHWSLDNGFIMGSAIGASIDVLWALPLSAGTLANPYKLNHYGLKVHRFGWQTESLHGCMID